MTTTSTKKLLSNCARDPKSTLSTYRHTQNMASRFRCLRNAVDVAILGSNLCRRALPPLTSTKCETIETLISNTLYRFSTHHHMGGQPSAITEFVALSVTFCNVSVSIFNRCAGMLSPGHV